MGNQRLAAKRLTKAKAQGRKVEIPKEELIRTSSQLRRVRIDKMVLNPQQHHFCEQYIIDSDQARAYHAAYGKKDSSAARKLLNLPKVSLYIAGKQKKLADRLGITQEFVLRELKAIAAFNIENYIKIGKDGQATIDLTAMEHDHSAALQSLTTKKFFDKTVGSEVHETTLKPWNKQQALELLGKYLGLKGFGTNKLEISGLDGGPIQVEQVPLLDEGELELLALGDGGGPIIEGEKQCPPKRKK